MEDSNKREKTSSEEASGGTANPTLRKVCLIGAGSYGTAVARVVADNLSRLNNKGGKSPFDPTLRFWARRASLAEEMTRNGENAQYLPGAKLPPNLRASSDLRGVVEGCDVMWDYSAPLTWDLPQDAILCIVHARRPCHSRYILSYQESFHNKLTTNRGTHLCRHYKTNWASLPWGFEMIKKRAHSICASIVFKATSTASMIESNH